MLRREMKQIQSIIRNAMANRASVKKRNRIANYLKGNRVPWSSGYEDFKWSEIAKAIHDEKILATFRDCKSLSGYGIGLDERLIEYPFVFSRIRNGKSVILDAGSTFNFETIVSHPVIVEKELCIYTYYPENLNFIEKRISYEFGDLRNLPFRSSWFDEVVCISTLEHVGLDNSMYGYREAGKTGSMSGGDSYRKVIEELLRVLKPGGQLLMTFPFGKNINYGFFQQFDSKMLQIILGIMNQEGTSTTTFFKYSPEGWNFSEEKSCIECESFNPHTGEGRGDDGAAHSRAICGIQFIKKGNAL